MCTDSSPYANTGHMPKRQSAKAPKRQSAKAPKRRCADRPRCQPHVYRPLLGSYRRRLPRRQSHTRREQSGHAGSSTMRRSKSVSSSAVAACVGGWRAGPIAAGEGAGSRNQRATRGGPPSTGSSPPATLTPNPRNATRLSKDDWTGCQVAPGHGCRVYCEQPRNEYRRKGPQCTQSSDGSNSSRGGQTKRFRCFASVEWRCCRA